MLGAFQGSKVCTSCRSRQELSNYGLLFKFSFFSLSPCPFFSIFFSNQIAIQTHIYLQNLASIQPRTSPVKFARSLAGWTWGSGSASSRRTSRSALTALLIRRHVTKSCQNIGNILLVAADWYRHKKTQFRIRIKPTFSCSSRLSSAVKSFVCSFLCNLV